MIKQITRQVITELKRSGVSVMMQSSATSGSIYLLLEYGMLGTLRISDHMPMFPVAHRFNLLTTCTEPVKVTGESLDHTDKTLVSMYYPIKCIDELVEEIKSRRDFVCNILTTERYDRIKFDLLEKERQRRLEGIPYYYTV